MFNLFLATAACLLTALLFAKSILDFCMSRPFAGAFDVDPELPTPGPVLLIRLLSGGFKSMA
jgi:hypothetical protein